MCKHRNGLLFMIAITAMLIIDSAFTSDPTLYLPTEYAMIQNIYVKSKVFGNYVAVNHTSGQFSHQVTTPQGFYELYFYFRSNNTFYTFTRYSSEKWGCTKRQNAGNHNLAMDPFRSDIITGMKYTGIVENCLNVMTQKIATCNRFDNKIVSNMVIDYYIETNHTGAFQLPLQMYKVVGDGKPTLVSTYAYQGTPRINDFNFPIPETNCQNQ